MANSRTAIARTAARLTATGDVGRTNQITCAGHTEAAELARLSGYVAALAEDVASQAGFAGALAEAGAAFAAVTALGADAAGNADESAIVVAVRARAKNAAVLPGGVRLAGRQQRGADRNHGTKNDEHVHGHSRKPFRSSHRITTPQSNLSDPP